MYLADVLRDKSQYSAQTGDKSRVHCVSVSDPNRGIISRPLMAFTSSQVPIGNSSIDRDRCLSMRLSVQRGGLMMMMIMMSHVLLKSPPK